MKVISIKEPFATLITNGMKKIETRSWKTNYRGEIFIHASGKSLAKEFLTNDYVIDLIKDINPMVGNLISESSLFFENRPSEYGNVMYAYTMNMMFAEMMVVFLENIDYYEYDYSLPSRVMHSLLKNQKDAVGVILEYSKCKDVHLFIKALFNVYKKEKGLMFRKEKEEYEKKKCILLS